RKGAISGTILRQIDSVPPLLPWDLHPRPAGGGAVARIPGGLAPGQGHLPLAALRFVPLDLHGPLVRRAPRQRHRLARAPIAGDRLPLYAVGALRGEASARILFAVAGRHLHHLAGRLLGLLLRLLPLLDLAFRLGEVGRRSARSRVEGVAASGALGLGERGIPRRRG